MSLFVLGLLLVGLVLLVGGAEVFVRGASRIAAMAGVSPLVIGLTVVSLGTSAPEIAVSVQSSFAGRGDLALGNIVGSNICNVLLILGIAAVIAPLYVSHQLIRLDVPVMIGISVLVLLFALDGEVTRMEGVILAVGALGYVGFLLVQSRKEGRAARETDEFSAAYAAPEDRSTRAWLLSLASIVGGLVLLVLGSRWLVSGAVTVAEAFGVSELIIGLTVIAVGTSLPEVATSVIASIKGERDIAVGNAIGSNIFNILVVLGLASIVAPGGIPVPEAAINFDIPVMIAVAVACLPIFATGNLIARWEGFVFLGYYLAYTVYLVLASTRHDALPVYSLVMMAFVIPLTVVTLLVVGFRKMRHQHAGRS
jgi:cation:H+ antiporter